jgi:hypothetical protein
MQPSRYEQRIRQTLWENPEGMAVDHDGAAYSWT